MMTFFQRHLSLLYGLVLGLAPLAAEEQPAATPPLAPPPLFLDIAEEGQAETYRLRAKAGDARGLRQYGEYLIEHQDCTGWSHLEKAAEAGEARALFLLAERHHGGLGGAPRNAEAAFSCLLRSAQGGYAPAHEMLARAWWDADSSWGATGFDFPKAREHLLQAISLYNATALEDADLEILRRQMVERLNEVLHLMVQLNPHYAIDWERLPEDCLPNYTALLASRFRPDTEDGLRARLYYIQRELETYTGTYLIDKLARIDLAKVRISIDKTYGGTIAFMRPVVSKEHFSFSITANPSKMFPSQTAYDTQERYAHILQHEMHLMNTLAHELFHGYLCSRYPALGRMNSQHASLTAYEGHATNAAYAFTRHWYFRGNEANLSPTTYTFLFEGALYTYYFQRFRTAFMTPEGKVSWDKLDLYEQRLQGNDRPVHTRRQLAEGEEFFRPKYFGRAFYGYM